MLAMVRRRERVWISEVFGTVIVGRPEPITWRPDLEYRPLED